MAQSDGASDAGFSPADSIEVQVEIAQAAVEHLWRKAGSFQKAVAVRPILQRTSYGRERVVHAKIFAQELANQLNKPLGPVPDACPLRVSIPEIRGDSTAEITVAHHRSSAAQDKVHIFRLRLQNRRETWEVDRLLNEAKYQIGDPALPWSEISFPIQQNPQLVGGMDALQDSAEYPPPARKARIESRVFVQFIVDGDGEVRTPKIESGGHELLNDAAIEAVKKQKFKPGTLRGEPVRVLMSLPVTFELPDSSSTQ